MERGVRQLLPVEISLWVGMGMRDPSRRGGSMAHHGVGAWVWLLLEGPGAPRKRGKPETQGREEYTVSEKRRNGKSTEGGGGQGGRRERTDHRSLQAAKSEGEGPEEVDRGSKTGGGFALGWTPAMPELFILCFKQYQQPTPENC